MESMKIEQEVPYPTIGEVLQNIFKWSGLWDYLGEEKKLKSLQTKLRRFASEETILTHDEIEKLICESLQAAVPHKTLGYAVARCFVLLMDGYRQTMRSEGSWLDRKDTAQWLFRCQIITPLVLNLQRAKMIFMEEHDIEHHYYFPEEIFWFLPTKKDGKWVMPLQNVMRWWLSTNKFETVEDFTGVSATTSSEWLNKESRPFIKTLKSLEGRTLHLPYDEANMKRSLTLCVMISNLVNNFFHAMCDLVGEDDVAQFISDFKCLYEAHENHEYRAFKKWVTPEIEKGRRSGEVEGCPHEELMREEFIALNDWEEKFHEEVFTPIMLKVAERVKETRSVDDLEGKGFIGESIIQNWSSQKSVVSEYFTPSTLQLIKDAERLREQIVDGGPSDWIQAQVLLPSFRERCMEAKGSFKFYPDYFDARLATYSGMYAEALKAYNKAFHACRYRASGVMKNCAEEYLILGSHLYLNQSKYGVDVKKPLLNYLHKWICLLYPISDYADPKNEDFVKFAASKFGG
jgi:hypothetical protein